MVITMEQAFDKCSKEEIGKALNSFIVEHLNIIKKNCEENQTRIEKIEETIKEFNRLIKLKEDKK